MRNVSISPYGTILLCDCTNNLGNFYLNFTEFVFVMVLGYLLSILILYSAYELMRGIVKVTEIQIFEWLKAIHNHFNFFTAKTLEAEYATALLSLLDCVYGCIHSTRQNNRRSCIFHCSWILALLLPLCGELIESEDSWRARIFRFLIFENKICWEV